MHNLEWMRSVSSLAGMQCISPEGELWSVFVWEKALRRMASTNYISR